MTLNFKEIPEANRGGGLQDSWELFCREFLLTIGYEILEDPSRGADGGLDLKVKLYTNDSQSIWLVSCKHKAHSGLSVTHSDELNIRDRVESKQCDGFIGFYSTLPSSGLLGVLEGLRAKTPYIIFDYEKIERLIVGFHSRERLFFRFFPESYKRFKETYYFSEPVKLFLNYFKSEFKEYDSIYKMLFHEIENILPYVRKGKTFEETLNEQNIRLLTIPEIEKTHRWEYKFLYSGISSDYTLHSLIYEMIPNETKYIHNIQVHVKPDSVSWGSGFEFGLYVIYSNCIVCSPKFVTKNNEIFKKLEEELT